MPMNRADYPPDWPAISKAVRERAGNRCEECGVANHAVGARDKHGEWHDENMIHGMNYDVGDGLFNGEFPDMVRIVLTVHHVDEDRTNNGLSNLVALCQRDHLAKHRAKRVPGELARRKRIERGQVALI
jgi:hypothetical protein